jgi:antitoxin CcdA
MRIQKVEAGMKRHKKRVLREEARQFQGIGRKAPGRKRPVNLSIDGALLKEARAAGMNLSAVVEAHLGDVLRQRRWQKWREDNKAAIEAHNEFVEKHGVWSDGLREF